MKSFTVIKEFHHEPYKVGNEYWSTESANLEYNDSKFKHPHNIVGYQHFTPELWNKLYELKGSKKLELKQERSYMHKNGVRWSFEVTGEELELCGIEFLLDRKNGWATSSEKGRDNPYFEHVSPKEAVDCIESFY